MNIETPFAPLLDLLVRSAALILIGTALIVALRKASAANRHAASVANFTAHTVRGTFAGLAIAAAAFAFCATAQLCGADEKKPAPGADENAPQIQIEAARAFVNGSKRVGKAPAMNADHENAELIVQPAPAKPAGAALKKAGTIFFPKIALDGVTLSETVEFLREKAKSLDPDGRGVKLILKPGGADPKITLRLSNVSLSEVLRNVADIAGFEVVADEQAITLRPRVK